MAMAFSFQLYLFVCYCQFHTFEHGQWRQWRNNFLFDFIVRYWMWCDKRKLTETKWINGKYTPAIMIRVVCSMSPVCVYHQIKWKRKWTERSGGSRINAVKLLENNLTISKTTEARFHGPCSGHVFTNARILVCAICGKNYYAISFAPLFFLGELLFRFSMRFLF